METLRHKIQPRESRTVRPAQSNGERPLQVARGVSSGPPTTGDTVGKLSDLRLGIAALAMIAAQVPLWSALI